jgi:hypothetical protein
MAPKMCAEHFPEFFGPDIFLAPKINFKDGVA